MKAKVLPADLSLDHVRLLVYWCEESKKSATAEAPGYVSWAKVMRWYEDEHSKLGFATGTDLIDRFKDFRLLTTPGDNPRSDAFRPSDQVLGALDDLYELRASLEVKAGLPPTPKPSAPATDRKKAARVEA